MTKTPKINVKPSAQSMKTGQLTDEEFGDDIAYFQEKLDNLNKDVAITEKQLVLLKDAAIVYRLHSNSRI
jgi:hypothetical protein